MTWENEEDIDAKSITHLYELRHACNVLGFEQVAKETNVPLDRITTLYESDIHGSENIKGFWKSSKEKFSEIVNELEEESLDYEESMWEIQEKNLNLVFTLEQKRKEFAGIGTNKSKRRLNKLAEINPVAKAVRVALETEDKNILAKKYYDVYKDRIYKKKTELILELCKIFKEQEWVYGIQKSENPSTSHIIYFEIPGVEQISWHFSPESVEELPSYKGEWDQKPNSTLEKLEAATIKLLKKGE